MSSPDVTPESAAEWAEAQRICDAIANTLNALGTWKPLAAMHAAVGIAIQIGEQLGGEELGLLSCFLLHGCNGDEEAAVAALRETAATMRSGALVIESAQKGSTS